MFDDVKLNVPLIRRRVPNLTAAARAVGLRPATVSNLCTGKIPVGRAEVRTLLALAALANCSMDELIIRDSGAGMIETGIKVIDLMAPLVRGGTVGLVARPGAGQVVILAELVRRLRQHGYATVAWAAPAWPAVMDEVIAETEVTCKSLDEVDRHISGLRAEADLLVVADRAAALSGEVLSLRERLQEAAPRPVTVALIDALGGAADEASPYGPLETLWRFDMDLAMRRILPAIDPVVSTSTLLEGAQLEGMHLTMQQRARKALRRYRGLRPLVEARSIEKLPIAERVAYRTGERLEQFLAQRLYVAEPFSQQPGEWVSLPDLLNGVRRVLDGETDA